MLWVGSVGTLYVVSNAGDGKDKLTYEVDDAGENDQSTSRRKTKTGVTTCIAAAATLSKQRRFPPS